MAKKYHISCALLALALGGCGSTQYSGNTCDYHRVPYCCDRTAGTGTEVANCPAPAPAAIEPAAGDELFRRSMRK